MGMAITGKQQWSITEDYQEIQSVSAPWCTWTLQYTAPGFHIREQGAVSCSDAGTLLRASGQSVV